MSIKMAIFESNPNRSGGPSWNGKYPYHRPKINLRQLFTMLRTGRPWNWPATESRWPSSYRRKSTIVSAKLTVTSQNVLAMMERHQSQISTAAPVWHELKYGCVRLPRSRKRSAIETFLNDVILPNIPVLAYDQRAAGWHALQRERLTSLGRTPSFVDGQIAAITAVHDLVLVTRNVRDFEVYDDLRIIDWHKSSDWKYRIIYQLAKKSQPIRNRHK